MDLDIKRVLKARPDAPQDSKLVPLTTSWGDALDCEMVLPEYPRPQFERATWQSLNGWWDYAIYDAADARHEWEAATAPEEWDGKILVPFSPEAHLSGVGRQLLPTQLLWYRRVFELDGPLDDKCLLLHFEAVDYACALYVNGSQITTHVGGYLPVDADITSVARHGENVIELCVFDPSEQGTQLRGKQRIVRGNMWYTAQSGIWQSVWLEVIDAVHVVSLSLQPDVDAGTLDVEAQLSDPGHELTVELLDDLGEPVARSSARAAETSLAVRLAVPAPHLWNVDDPYLYGIHVTYATDEVRSYCAFRTVGIERDADGVARFCLNHRPLFLRGVLDQGYWPEGLMTAPSDEALVADIESMREAGFNMLRKHIKLESERWYWHCDRLGMLVFQDMVSGGGIPEEWASVNIPTLFRRSWSSGKDTTPRAWQRYGADDEAYRTEWLQTAHAAIARLTHHPCVVTWVVFNESWGQFSSKQMTEELRAQDSSRPFVATSGWYDQGAGDYYAVHNYFRSMRVYKDPHARRQAAGAARAFIIDEFGGLTCPVEGHVSVPDITYGYDAFDDINAWRDALRALLAEMDALEEQGLAGFVYTQVSDVEEETNGILTYDRRVNKLG
ncbi:MAG: glycoside hydrolase family 2 [Atopobiaceae bacterium]|nr:glycoside hydrolase family 2 [Atopobiaceae bacterium]